MGQQVAEREAQGVRIVEAILAIARKEGPENILRVFIETCQRLAKEIENPSTGSTCGVCGEGLLHFLASPTVILDNLDQCLQAGAVLKAIDECLKGDWFSGKVERAIDQAKQKALERRGWAWEKPKIIEGIPTLERVVGKFPIYICTHCGALSLGGAAGIEVKEEV